MSSGNKYIGERFWRNNVPDPLPHTGAQQVPSLGVKGLLNREKNQSAQDIDACSSLRFIGQYPEQPHQKSSFHHLKKGQNRYQAEAGEFERNQPVLKGSQKNHDYSQHRLRRFYSSLSFFEPLPRSPSPIKEAKEGREEIDLPGPTVSPAPLSPGPIASSLLYRRRHKKGRSPGRSNLTSLANVWAERGTANNFAGNNDDIFVASEPIEPDIREETDEQDLSIPECMYLRAVKAVYSKDPNHARDAHLILRRLAQAGFKNRPKAMSSPAKPLSVPTVKVTVHAEDRPSSASDNHDNELHIRGVGRTLSTSHRRLSMSDSNLSRTDCTPTAVIFDSMYTTRRRKDSVSLIRKRPSIPGINQRRRRSSSSVTSQHLSTDGHRGSCCGTICSGKTDAPLSPDDVSLTTWSSLLSCIPEDERKDSYISRHHICIYVPVCQVGKEKPLTFTSLEVIEQNLRRLYPELVVKKRLSSYSDSANCHEDNGPASPIAPLKSDTTQLSRKIPTDFNPSINRRSSINTCIFSMRNDMNDYDRQLLGVKAVGTFADEETLKVLIAKGDAISCVIEAMKAFPEKEEMQMNACSSLLKMASSSEANCVHILANDGLSAITTTLRTHHDNVEIVRLLFSTIAFISTGLDPAASLVSAGMHTLVLTAMSRHSTDKHIVKECCFIIGNLLSSVETAQQLMYVGGVHTIISLVKQFPDDVNILENVCRTLGSFAIYDETCLDVALAGATSTVLKAMETPANTASVIECGCWAMASLTGCVQTCEELVNAGGVKTIVKVLKDYPKEQSLQEYGIRVLYNLSSYDETLPVVCTEEVVIILSCVLNEFQDSVELLEIICTTLCQMLIGDDRLCTFVVERKCLKNMIHVMMEYPEHCGIQESCCKIIGNIAVHDDRRKMAEMYGASKAVISAMLTNESNAEVQEVGCLALMNLTAENKDNKVRIKNAGAVPALLSTLREFSYDPNIVLCALKALGNLVSLEEVCHLLLDEKGLETIISLTKSHSSNEEVLVFVTMILCGVTELPDLKEEETSQIDKTLVEILSNTQNNADITMYVCQATENVLRTDVGRETFMQNNRLGIIQAAINSYPNNPEIHRTCCKVIAVVAFHMDSKRRMITETTVKSVLKSMELFPMEAEIQIVGCGTFACILEKIAILKHEVIGQGGMQVIQNAVNNHVAESRLAVVALMALGYVLPLDRNKYPDESRMVYDIIIQCMNNFGENKEIQISGSRALSLFNFSDKNDVKTMASTIINSLRRHGEEPEIQKNAALALRPSYQEDGFLDIISEVLKSPSLRASEVFWKEFETDKK